MTYKIEVDSNPKSHRKIFTPKGLIWSKGWAFMGGAIALCFNVPPFPFSLTFHSWVFFILGITWSSGGKHDWSMCVKKVSKLLTILLRILLKQNTALPSTGGTSQLFSSIWLFRAWKPYNLLKDIIQTDHPDHSYHLTPWTNWTTLTTPTDQTIYQDKCRIRIVILGVVII